MKKILAMAIIAAMTFAMAACGSSAPASDGGSGSSSSSGEGAQFNVGVCQLVQHDALDAATQGFQDALDDILGEGVASVDVQNAQGDSTTCATIINKFVSQEVDLIMANATPALQAAAAGTADIPILGTSVTEYGVALELDNFTGLVGRNISGTSDLAPLNEQAAMILEWFPDTKTVGLLYCSAEANSQYQVDMVKAELEKLGVSATYYSFADSNDLATIATNAATECDVIYVPTDNTVASNAELIDNICAPAGVPVIAGEEGICAGCGVATLSISYYDLGYETGKMAASILKGEANISEMEIAYAPNFTKKYNKAKCEALEVAVPEGYVAIE